MDTNPHNSQPLGPMGPMVMRSGLAEDELLDFIEGELPADRSAAVLRVLAAHPELSRAVMAMRADRGELSHELELTLGDPDPAFVESVVHQGVTGEWDPAFAERFEATGRTSDGGIRHMQPTRIVRAHRLRFPARAVGTLLAASVALAFFGAIWLAWPAPPAAPAPTAVAAGSASEAARVDVPSTDAPIASGEALALAESTDTSSPVEWGPTSVIVTPAEALAAAQEGRLVIRVYSPDAQVGRSLVESITMAPSVSRVAVLEGRLDDLEADQIASAIPLPTGPVFAGDPSGIDAERAAPAERASWVYMLEVEPTERGMSLLMAGLSREPGVLVELLRSGEPVTTPGSAGDVSWFRSPSRDWTRRIAAPVVVQSGEH